MKVDLKVEKLVSVSASPFRGWKIWNPVFSALFFSGVGFYYWYSGAGLVPVIDGLMVAVVVAAVAESVWMVSVLKEVKMDEKNLYVSGIRETEAIPLIHVESIIDRTHLKRRIPSSIVFDERLAGKRRIRFIPAQPKSKVIAELKAEVERSKSGS